MRDPSLDAAVDSVLKGVALQLAASQATSDQLRDCNPTILGYVATLADLESKNLAGQDQRAAAALIAILVMSRLSGNSIDPGELESQFHELEVTRDFHYGQGGAMALEDHEIAARGKVPHALAVWIRHRVAEGGSARR